MDLDDMTKIFKKLVTDTIAQRTEYQIKRESDLRAVENQNDEFDTHYSRASVYKSQSTNGEQIQNFMARESLRLRSRRAGVSINDFEPIHQIGKGAYSVVTLVRYKPNGKIYALKKIFKEKVGNSQEGVRVRTERAVMLHFSSKYIVKLHYVFQDDTALYFAMDYAAGGDLSNLLNACGCLPEHWVRRWFAQMLQAVLLLHGTDVIASIGLDDDFDIKERIQMIKNQSKEDLMEPFEFSIQEVPRPSSIIFRQGSQQKMIAKSKLNCQLGCSSDESDNEGFASALLNDSNEPTRKNPKLVLELDSSTDSKRISFSRSHMSNGSQSSNRTPIKNYRELLTQQEFIHRDLKPQNFLITHKGDIMLADFGLAKEIDMDMSLSRQQSLFIASKNNTVVGTLNYISPEQYKQGVYGKFVDFWALGCILYEMLCGQVAFQEDDPDQLAYKMQTSEWKDIKPNYSEEFQYLSPEAQDLINNLLCEPEKRLGRSVNMQQLITHPFFTQGETVENILQLNNETLKNFILNPENVGENELQKLPILPYEPLLQHIQSPWKPPIENETDLQFFKQDNDELDLEAALSQLSESSSTAKEKNEPLVIDEIHSISNGHLLSKIEEIDAMFDDSDSQSEKILAPLISSFSILHCRTYSTQDQHRSDNNTGFKQEQQHATSADFVNANSNRSSKEIRSGDQFIGIEYSQADQTAKEANVHKKYMKKQKLEQLERNSDDQDEPIHTNTVRFKKSLDWMRK
ncbi:Kinase [Hexamita inflata]|uniref:non-specific serine/threonine protein kinase n=1 Tax=Hexamita inflata TaxID=28002 RepID=A0AA86NID6_9EUKA|nr:AGC NDR [Hexamita inflata]